MSRSSSPSGEEVTLTEEKDLPGAKLSKPHDKQFWLKCRGVKTPSSQSGIDFLVQH